MTLFPSVAVLGVKPVVSDILEFRGYPLLHPVPNEWGAQPDQSLRADVVVAAAENLDADVLDAVRGGSGLVVLGSSVALPDAGIQGIVADAELRTAGSEKPHEGQPLMTSSEDLLARVDAPTLRASGSLTLNPPAEVLLRAGGSPVAAVSQLELGRVVVLSVQEPDTASMASGSYSELLFNAINYAARPPSCTARRAAHPLVSNPQWMGLKNSVVQLQQLQIKNGSVPSEDQHPLARQLVDEIIDGINGLAPHFRHDADYLAALVKDFTRWTDGNFQEPDFLDSMMAFAPARNRVDGQEHLVLFPMYTQNGSTERKVEAVLLQVIWPDFIAELESGNYSNKLFLPIRFLDFTPGYDTNSAVLFPETVAMRELPKFTWGGIFADREAARFRRVVSSAAEVTNLRLPPDAARLVADQDLAERTFVMWDLIHDRTHMHGDLPFDPFMIKQRMPYFLYSLEELRCDLTAFRESVKLEQQGGHPHARMVQYAVLFDRIFRFPISGNRTRNYDGLGGQLLFAWLHQHGVLQWTDNRLTIDWQSVTEPVLELGRRIEDLYWRSIDRPKIAHWLAAYELVSSVLTPNPLSSWARFTAGDRDALPLDGPPKGLTDQVLDDEFPLSMFYEALNKKMKDVVASTSGITG